MTELQPHSGMPCRVEERADALASPPLPFGASRWLGPDGRQQAQEPRRPPYRFRRWDRGQGTGQSEKELRPGVPQAGYVAQVSPPARPQGRLDTHAHTVTMPRDSRNAQGRGADGTFTCS